MSRFSLLRQTWLFNDSFTYSDFIAFQEARCVFVSNDEEVIQLAGALEDPKCQLKELHVVRRRQGTGLGCGARGAQALGRALRVNKTLVGLFLSWNPIGDDGAQAIAEGIPGNTSLESLHLDHCGIGCIGAQAFGKMLRINKRLKYLNFDENHIGDDGAQALAGALPANTTLGTLRLRRNAITDVGAHVLADALRLNRGLRTFTIPLNRLGREGKATLEGVRSFPIERVASFLITSSGASPDREMALSLFHLMEFNKTISYLGV